MQSFRNLHRGSFESLAEYIFQSMQYIEWNSHSLARATSEDRKITKKLSGRQLSEFRPGQGLSEFSPARVKRPC